MLERLVEWFTHPLLSSLLSDTSLPFSCPLCHRKLYFPSSFVLWPLGRFSQWTILAEDWKARRWRSPKYFSLSLFLFLTASLSWIQLFPKQTFLDDPSYYWRVLTRQTQPWLQFPSDGPSFCPLVIPPHPSVPPSPRVAEFFCCCQSLGYFTTDFLASPLLVKSISCFIFPLLKLLEWFSWFLLDPDSIHRQYTPLGNKSGNDDHTC